MRRRRCRTGIVCNTVGAVVRVVNETRLDAEGPPAPFRSKPGADRGSYLLPAMGEEGWCPAYCYAGRRWQRPHTRTSWPFVIFTSSTLAPAMA